MLISNYLASCISLFDNHNALDAIGQGCLPTIHGVNLVWLAEVDGSMVVRYGDRSVDASGGLGARDGQVLDFPSAADVGVACVVETEDNLAAAIWS